MSIRKDYEDWLKVRQEIRDRPHGGEFFNQENRYIAPFHIYGRVYYVGDDWVCAHLIDTGDGLLLIDAGNCGGSHVLIHSIWKMGFTAARSASSNMHSIGME